MSISAYVKIDIIAIFSPFMLSDYSAINCNQGCLKKNTIATPHVGQKSAGFASLIGEQKRVPCFASRAAGQACFADRLALD
jgi:hypothetical protein